MHINKRQNGMTLIGLLFLLSLIGFFALVIMKLTPLYLESFKINGAMDSIVKDPSVSSWSNAEITKRFISRVDVEDIDRFTRSNLKEYLTITKTKDGNVTLDIDYDAEAPLFGNITLIAAFNKTVSSE